MRIIEFILCGACVISITSSITLCYKTLKRDSWTFRFYVTGGLFILFQCMLIFGYLANSEMFLLTAISKVFKDLGTGLGFVSLSFRISSFLPNGPFTCRVFSYHYPTGLAGFLYSFLIIRIVMRETNLEQNIGLFPGTLTFFLVLIMGILDMLYAIYLCQLAFKSRSDKNSENQKVLHQMALLFLLKLSVIGLALYFQVFTKQLLTDSLTGIYYATDGIFLYIFRKMTVHRVKQEKLMETNYSNHLT
jgi:hypothetical protein